MLALRPPLVASLVLLCGCPETRFDRGDVGPESGVVYSSIIVSPAVAKLKVRFKGGEPLQFYAHGIRPGGIKEPLVGVQWSIDNSAVGSMEAGGGFVAAGVGGKAQIFASYEGQSASAQLTALLEDQITESGVSDADLQRLAKTPTTDGARAPVVLYPETSTMIPRNLLPMVLQWKQGDSGNVVFGIRIVGTYLDVLVATTQQSWTADKSSWSAFIRSCAGSSLSFHVSGAAKSGPVYAGPTATSITVSELSAPGTIYYWATGPEKSLKNGILQINAFDDKATDYYTQANNGTQRCPGCHAVTRDGAKMVFTEYPLKSWENYAKGVDVRTKKTFLPQDKYIGNFFAFSRSGDRLLYAEAGGMTIRKMSDSSVLTSFTSILGQFASHPDWSPTEDRVAFALYPTKYDYAENFCSASIALADVPAAGGSWSPKILVKSTNSDDNNYYPTFTPDGKHIVFSKAGRYNNTKLGEYDCDCYANPDATLFMIPVTGGSAIALQRANGQGRLTNSWAKWAPAEGNTPIWWMAFSSTRDYGRILVNSDKQDIRGQKLPQIWISAIRRDLLAKGKDPSFPAFWLPGQRIDSGNHIPFWTKTLK